jgi:hypothetical protein
MLLRQILRQLKHNIPASVKAEYGKYKDDEHTKTKPETFMSLLKDCVSQLAAESSNDVFILIDAFDEFKTMGNERAERTQIQKCLHELTEMNKARLLITTRHEPLESLRSTFKSAVEVEIRADPSDVDRYIDEVMEGHTRPEDLQLKAHLKTRVKESSAGL